MNSSFFSLNWADLGKSVLVASLTAFLTAVSLSIEAGHLPSLVELKTSGYTALVAGAAYLVKNLLTNSLGTFASKEK